MSVRKLELPPNPNKITFIKPREIEVGASISGYYLESREDQYGKPGYKLKTSEGKVVVNSATELDKYMALEEVKPGLYLQITRQEDETITGGPHKGKAKFMFTVAIVEDVAPLTEEELAAELEAEEEAQEKKKPAPRKPAALSKVK